MNNLQLGSQGAEVKTLQEQLISAGFAIIADGVFGPATENAVKQFQQKKQLTVDGIVGPSTQAALNGSNIPTLSGIDISHFTGSINWNTLGSEVSFVYAKASQGSQFKDPTFSSNFANLAKAVIIRGGYHFLTFQNTAQDQANNFLSCGVDYSQHNILPPVLDIEWQVPSTLNPYILNNRQQCIALIADWLQTVEAKTGRLPMIYTNASFWQQYLNNPPGFEKYLVWQAAYSSSRPANIPNLAPYTFWQNGENGRLASISTGVDTNIFYGSLDDLKKLASA